MPVYFTKGYLYQIALFFILQEAIESPFCHRIYLTRINQEFEADAFFPMFDENVYKLIRYLYCWCHRLAHVVDRDLAHHLPPFFRGREPV